jgi:lipid II:glycine glycyltransferase (peptidoglycan interpeptide bridge formation enzyme)
MFSKKNNMIRYYSTKFLNFGEIYHCLPPNNKLIYNNLDVLIASLCPQKPKWGYSEDFHTLIIDLTQPEDEIFNKIDKNTRYEINRAKNKDGITSKTLDVRYDLGLFLQFYNKFALTKNLCPIDGVGQTLKQIEWLAENDMFTIRAALFKDEIVVMHSYVCNNGRAKQAHSASLFRESEDNTFRRMAGRANRWLHWDDMLYFKSRNFPIYDLGGISMNLSDKEKQAVGEFKKSIGGELVKERMSYIPMSVKGWMYVAVKAMRKWMSTGFIGK